MPLHTEAISVKSPTARATPMHIEGLLKIDHTHINMRLADGLERLVLVYNKSCVLSFL